MGLAILPDPAPFNEILFLDEHRKFLNLYIVKRLPQRTTGLGILSD